VQIRHYICGHLADFLRVKTVSRSDVTCNDVIGHHVGPIKGHKGRREQNDHGESSLPVENSDVSKMEYVEQEEGNGMRSTSDVQCGIRDLLETKDQTSTAPSFAAAAAAGQSVSPLERLLVSINDMIETKLRSDDQLRHQSEVDQQIMNEWMIAAAVIDRLCFIIFGLCFLIGTAVLFSVAIFVAY